MLKPIVWPVLAPSLLFAVGLGAVLPVMVLGALDLGSSSSFAAAVVGIMGAVSLVATVPAGILVDRLGDFRAMLAATIAAVIILGGIVVAFVWDSAASLALYTVALMLFAPVSDVWNLARQAVVAEVMPPQDLSKAMTALGGTQRVGNLIGPIVGAGLMLVFPLWSVFVFSAVASVAAIVIMALPIAQIPGYSNRGTPRAGSPGANAADAGATTSPSPAEAVAPKSGQPPRPRLEVRWKAVILVGISMIALTVARSAQPVVIQLWGVEIGLQESSISLLIAFGAGLELIFMLLGAYIKDHLGRTTTLVACLTIFGSGFVVMVLRPDLAGMVAAAAIMAVGNGLGAGINMTIGADLSPAIGRARFLGIWAIFSNGGKLAGPTVVSLVISIASLRFGILFPGLFAILGAVWIIIWSTQIGLPSRRRR
ncbi:MAG: MFS transporter [Brevibacterium sp.]|uniref:MFS transporter n=1 Tax=Brevibacterium sp. TaxID=1701 RepID=UPI002647EEFB|nr:MFS transporter [Brevibacterium sp.]MDN5807133.1 MFS transporter [Brevibacterium sp.]MDN5833866.1 MFS transporter [Brevibacterium sp.]MDN5876263.1 MFS transporter [Brevibacterium sp.]MDN5909934.1 MFS transporter [Brevibacterium sp.]MDN6124283.1 MFS transporter [Brevibacterium sp.]